MKRVNYILIFLTVFIVSCGALTRKEQIPDKPAAAIGGFNEFYNKFASKYNVPDIAETGTQVKIFLQFVVEKDGSITDVKVLNDPGYGFGNEAVRVLKSMPEWEPAEKNGHPID